MIRTVGFLQKLSTTDAVTKYRDIPVSLYFLRRAFLNTAHPYASHDALQKFLAWSSVKATFYFQLYNRMVAFLLLTLSYSVFMRRHEQRMK